jgi:hypothetical protein
MPLLLNTTLPFYSIEMLFARVGELERGQDSKVKIIY